MAVAVTNAGLGTPVHFREVGAAAHAAETPAHRKLRKAAQEFEGILISELLKDFQMGFSSLGASAPLTGSDTLNSLGIQALSGAMARQGGFGIAPMLVQQLEPSLDRRQHSLGGGKIKTASRG